MTPNTSLSAPAARVEAAAKTGIPEADNYAGFPVGGSFLMTENPAVTAQHGESVWPGFSRRAADVGAAP